MKRRKISKKEKEKFIGFKEKKKRKSSEATGFTTEEIDDMNVEIKKTEKRKEFNMNRNPINGKRKPRKAKLISEGMPEPKNSKGVIRVRGTSR
jgi:hypothetical protein